MYWPEVTNQVQQLTWMGQSLILLLGIQQPPFPHVHASSCPQSWFRFFIIDLMASTWKRDNQTPFPVKQSCCFTSPSRKNQWQHATCFSYMVTFGFAESWKWDICPWWSPLHAFCICANKHWVPSICVITYKSCPYPYLIIQMRHQL